MAQPVWVTAAGDLGTIAENLFFSINIVATDPDGGTPVYTLIAGDLPAGIQVTSTGAVEGVPQAFTSVKGVPTEVSENVTSTFAIRATSPDGLSINDRTFSLTVTGQDIPQFTTAAGSLGTFYDCDNVNITIGFTDSDPNDTVVISVDNGELPPGLTLDPTTGLITGHISAVSNLPDDATSGYDASQFDEYPFDFATRAINKNYEFTLSISDGKNENLRTFTMFVVSRDSLTADTTDFTADSMVLTADLSPSRTPYITNYPAAISDPVTPAGTIGTFRHNNFFAYQLLGFDCDGSAFEFEIVLGDSADLPPGINFDRTTGWLTGYFPDQGATETTYEFDITIYKASNNSVVSTPYKYYITVIGSIESAVIWSSGTLVPGTGTGTGKTAIYSLGTIDNGAVSMFEIIATNPSGRVLLFKLKSGSYPSTPGTYNLLPQGLQLLESGHIAGRVSFNTFTFDSGTTTFDKDVTTRLVSAETLFDKNFDFTVTAYSSDGLVSIDRTFRIVVDREYNEPYQGLYIKAMPDRSDRALIASLLQDTDIIDPARVYRSDDPYFGVAKDVVYNHAFSLNTASLDEYVTALSKNHFRKKLILGGIKTAQALNADGTVAYEVVYSNVVDTGVNKEGESPAQSLTLPYEVTIQSDSATDFYQEFLNNYSNGNPDTDPDVTLLADQTDAFLDRFKDLNLLANVASQMAKDWMNQGQPGDPAERFENNRYIPNPEKDTAFSWAPSNKCENNTDARYNKFKTQLEDAAAAGRIIYSQYTLSVPNQVLHVVGTPATGPKKVTIESIAPFGFLIEEGDAAYLVLRGTQTNYDGTLDTMIGQVDNPITNGKFRTGKAHNGFTTAFNGLGPTPNYGATRTTALGESLYEALTRTTKKKLYIGGHSLGSAVATLVTAYAQSLNLFDEIKSYVSASPTVGNKFFVNWMKDLQDLDGNKLGENFFRLTNSADTVPMVPGTAGGYTNFAKEIQFTAEYKPGDAGNAIAQRHQICCCYAYALHHHLAPVNPDIDTCNFPKGPETANDLSAQSHLLQLQLFFGEFSLGAGGNSIDQSFTTVYPNSLVNMRDRVISIVGQTSTVLPLWMTSKQTDGRVLGFTKAWVIAYVNAGESDRISYNIRSKFGEILNRVDFISDRYILDNQLTANWKINEDSVDGGEWFPSPPDTTTFNADQTTNPTASGKETTFDGNSLRFTRPSDVYGKTDKHDKYLVYPTDNILGSADSTTTVTHVSSGNVVIDQSLDDYEGPYYVFGTSNSGFTDETKGYFYPLYLNRTLADAADTGTGSTTLGNGTSHVHTFDEFPGITFYMPNSSMNHGEAIKPDLPEYTYSGNLGPIGSVVEDTTPNAPSTPNTPISPGDPGYSGGGSSGGGSSGGGSGGGGGGYGSSSSSSSYSY